MNLTEAIQKEVEKNFDVSHFEATAVSKSGYSESSFLFKNSLDFTDCDKQDSKIDNGGKFFVTIRNSSKTRYYWHEDGKLTETTVEELLNKTTTKNLFLNTPIWVIVLLRSFLWSIAVGLLAVSIFLVISYHTKGCLPESLVEAYLCALLFGLGAFCFNISFNFWEIKDLIKSNKKISDFVDNKDDIDITDLVKEREKL